MDNENKELLEIKIKINNNFILRLLLIVYGFSVLIFLGWMMYYNYSVYIMANKYYSKFDHIDSTLTKIDNVIDVFCNSFKLNCTF